MSKPTEAFLHLLSDSSPRHTELTTTLDSTRPAVVELAEVRRTIADLSSTLKQRRKTLRELKEEQKKKERSQGGAVSHAFNRLAYAVSRRSREYEELAQHARQETADAIQAERATAKEIDSLNALLDEASGREEDLVLVTKQHAETLTELDELYDLIFSGPTPGFAHEDEQEAAKSHAQQTLDTTKGQVEAETAAEELLRRAVRQMQLALDEMRCAKHHSRWDLATGGGLLTEVMKRSALTGAENALKQAQALVVKAQSISPPTQTVVRPEVVRNGSIWSGMVFSTYWHRRRFLDDISAGKIEVKQCVEEVKQQLSLSRARLGELQGLVKEDEATLDNEKDKLRRIRREIFEQQQQRAQ